MFANIFLVGLGGFIGSSLRYSISLFLERFPIINFPFATFSVNIIGSFIIGFIMSMQSMQNSPNQSVKLLFAVGFCGGFTTFSSFALENVKLLQEKQYEQALLYISASLIIGILSVFAGIFIAKFFMK